MKKILLLFMTVLICACASLAWAQEAADKQGNEYPKENLVGEITHKEMEEYLNSGKGEDRVYVSYSEEKVLVFQGLGLDDSVCKQIVIAMPEEKMLQIYSNDKKACNRLYKAAKNFNQKLVTMNGHNVVVDKSQTTKINDQVSIHKFWLKKFRVESNPQTVRVKRRGFSLPIGIGIGIGHHGHGHVGIGL